MSEKPGIYKKAPPGFTKEQWQKFAHDGYLQVENALSSAECDRYIDAIDRLSVNDTKFDPQKFYRPQNIVEKDSVFAEIIDHPRHIGFAYDIYGELLKLHLSQCVIRPPHSWHNLWHPDGARALPFGNFSPVLPMQLKVSYWLTDVPESRMGNLVVLPGSHTRQYMEHYDTHESASGEHVMTVARGTMTLMHCNTWHRVEVNESAVTRKNIFFAYCPSWIVAEDRYQNNAEWLRTLPRERRIIMRSYGHPYTNTKPPPEDFPLFLDRKTGMDRDPGVYREHIELSRRKRLTGYEKGFE